MFGVGGKPMIIDNLDNFDMYCKLNNSFKIVKDFLSSNDLSGMECGRYELDGDKIFLSLQTYDTKLEKDCMPEAHRKYLDIQLVVSGQEKIGYVPLSTTSPSIPYDEKNDIEFLNGISEFLLAKPGSFFVFYPQDAHTPSVAISEPQKVKKAVFKIKLN